MTLIDEGRRSFGLDDGADAIGGARGTETEILGPPPSSAPRRTWVTGGRLAVGAAIIAVAVAVIGVSVVATRPGRPATSPGLATGTGSTLISPPVRVPSSASSGHASSAEGSNAIATIGPEQPPSTVPPVATGAGVAPEIEETGSLTLGVGKGRLAAALSELTNMATARGGFVASTSTQVGSRGSGAPMGDITLEVPQATFATTVAQAQTLGHVTSLSTRGTDVTGQYVDLQARIAALEASRQQYLTILSKATTIGDILAVQSQLDTLQSQLEQLQGQLQVMDSQTTYATLVVSVTAAKTGHYVPPGPESGIGRAWHQAVSGFVDGFEDVIRVAGPALFVLLCLAGVGLVGRMAWRAGRRRVL